MRSRCRRSWTPTGRTWLVDAGELPGNGPPARGRLGRRTPPRWPASPSSARCGCSSTPTRCCPGSRASTARPGPAATSDGADRPDRPRLRTAGRDAARTPSGPVAAAPIELTARHLPGGVAVRGARRGPAAAAAAGADRDPLPARRRPAGAAHPDLPRPGPHRRRHADAGRRRGGADHASSGARWHAAAGRGRAAGGLARRSSAGSAPGRAGYLAAAAAAARSRGPQPACRTSLPDVGPAAGPSASPARPVLLPGPVAGGRLLRRRAALQPARASPVAEELRTAPDPARAAVGGARQRRCVIDEGLAWMFDYDRAVEAGMAITVPLTGDAAGRRPTASRRCWSSASTRRSSRRAAAELDRLLAAHARTDGLAFVAAGHADEQHRDGRLRLDAARSAARRPGRARAGDRSSPVDRRQRRPAGGRRSGSADDTPCGARPSAPTPSARRSRAMVRVDLRGGARHLRPPAAAGRRRRDALAPARDERDARLVHPPRHRRRALCRRCASARSPTACCRCCARSSRADVAAAGPPSTSRRWCRCWSATSGVAARPRAGAGPRRRSGGEAARVRHRHRSWPSAARAVRAGA